MKRWNFISLDDQSQSIAVNFVFKITSAMAKNTFCGLTVVKFIKNFVIFCMITFCVFFKKFITFFFNLYYDLLSQCHSESHTLTVIV